MFRDVVSRIFKKIVIFKISYSVTVKGKCKFIDTLKISAAFSVLAFTRLTKNEPYCLQLSCTKPILFRLTLPEFIFVDTYCTEFLQNWTGIVENTDFFIYVFFVTCGGNWVDFLETGSC